MSQLPPGNLEILEICHQQAAGRGKGVLVYFEIVVSLVIEADEAVFFFFILWLINFWQRCVLFISYIKVIHSSGKTRRRRAMIDFRLLKRDFL